ncbi:unannotated protein [freshwater metagenome]|uniref:Unannotated protein n=1 Tax=freshwater metagenome TaxID=449393 RepID=A0A6J6H1H6_9ZZZZ
MESHLENVNQDYILEFQKLIDIQRAKYISVFRRELNQRRPSDVLLQFLSDHPACEHAERFHLPCRLEILLEIPDPLRCAGSSKLRLPHDLHRQESRPHRQPVKLFQGNLTMKSLHLRLVHRKIFLHIPLMQRQVPLSSQLAPHLADRCWLRVQLVSQIAQVQLRLSLRA